jgi:hypothetical protein
VVVADRLCEFVRVQQKMNCVTSVASDDIVGDGSQEYETRGPGLYRMDIRVQLNASVGGNMDSTNHQTADLTVGVFDQP